MCPFCRPAQTAAGQPGSFWLGQASAAWHSGQAQSAHHPLAQPGAARAFIQPGLPSLGAGSHVITASLQPADQHAASCPGCCHRWTSWHESAGSANGCPASRNLIRPCRHASPCWADCDHRPNLCPRPVPACSCSIQAWQLRTTAMLHIRKRVEQRLGRNSLEDQIVPIPLASGRCQLQV